MIKIANNFDLKNTVFSGQCFRMSVEDGYILLIIDDRILKIKELKNSYEIYSNNEENLREKVASYFDLDRNYEEINRELILKDKSIAEIINASKGYKVLKQNKFEMFISYIISQNNNVKKISDSINRISEMFGKKILYNNKEYYLFPKYEEIKNITYDDLKLCKVGFRAKYIMNALEKIEENNNYLDKIEKMNSKDAYDELMKIKGIGPKVASCILLFGFERFDVFPIDTWAKKYLMNKYKINNIKALEQELYNKYGKNVGICIQYMFNYERNIKKSIIS